MTNAMRSSSGFILPLTLWIVAIMGLVVATMNMWVQTAVANARSLREKTDSQLAMSDIRNELIYALAARPKSSRGLEVGTGLPVLNNSDFMAALSTTIVSSRSIALDHRPYVTQSHPDYVIQIQDGRGLFQMNFNNQVSLRRFLSAMKFPEAERNRLTDTLLDYTDEDNYTRLAGAEAIDYQRLGLPPPANESLLTPYEAKRVMAWSEEKLLWEADMRSPLLTTCEIAGFNPNTAPVPVLMAQMPRLSADAIARLIEARRTKTFANQAQLTQAAGELVYDEAFFYSFVPSECLIVDLLNTKSGEHNRFSLTLRPLGKGQPWRYDYELRIPAQYALRADQIDGTAFFPAPESLHTGADEQPLLNAGR